jgi:hypothetical protein
MAARVVSLPPMDYYKVVLNAHHPLPFEEF